MPINHKQILLKTERLVLRRFIQEDIDHIFALDNDPDVMRYLNGGVPTARGVVEEKIFPSFLSYDEVQPNFGFWAVEHQLTGEFLGWVSLRPTGDNASEAALGYRFCKAAWGQGYATEGCKALIAQGFSGGGVLRVVATTYEENLASQRVMEKLGMTLVRRFRITEEDLAQNDTYHVESADVWDGDDVEYAIDKSAWEASM